ncbi:MAG: hypothetical protein OEY01_13940 [Desulfobulbaceae bacterium]|nr:hypothetical protein [Desulfobulbaceae bacterium]HIJ79813.1 hypothetical protein [Deltaproteobacteria bacterium]
MGKENRRAPRFESNLPVTLTFMESEGKVIGEPVLGSINDISTFGARVTVPRIKSGELHIFYSFNDNEDRVINLEVVDIEFTRKLIIPAQPVWFDHMLTTPNRPFQLGLEFITDPGNPDVSRVHKLVTDQKNIGKNWFQKLFAIG